MARTSPEAVRGWRGLGEDGMKDNIRAGLHPGPSSTIHNPSDFREERQHSVLSAGAREHFYTAEKMVTLSLRELADIGPRMPMHKQVLTRFKQVLISQNTLAPSLGRLPSTRKLTHGSTPKRNVSFQRQPFTLDDFHKPARAPECLLQRFN